MSALCDESNCPACGAQCERHIDHDGPHKCINCGCTWYSEEDDEEE